MPKQSLSDDLRSIAAAGEELWIDPFTQEQSKGLEYAHRRIIEAADRIEELEALAAGLHAVIDEPIPQDLQ